MDRITDARAEIEHAIGALRADVGRITEALRRRGFDVAEGAEDTARHMAGSVTRHAGEAVDAARSEIVAVARTARENPATTATLLTVAGLIGFAAGYLAAHQPTQKPWWDR